MDKESRGVPAPVRPGPPRSALVRGEDAPALLCVQLDGAPCEERARLLQFPHGDLIRTANPQQAASTAASAQAT
jgi:hypothetical protein